MPSMASEEWSTRASLKKRQQKRVIAILEQALKQAREDLEAPRAETVEVEAVPSLKGKKAKPKAKSPVRAERARDRR